MSALTVKHCRGPRVRADHSACCAMVCLAKHLIFVWRKQVVACLNVIFSPWKITQKAVKNKFTKRKWTSCMQGASVFEKPIN